MEVEVAPHTCTATGVGCGGGATNCVGRSDLHQVDDNWQCELLLLGHRLGVDVEVIQAPLSTLCMENHK